MNVIIDEYTDRDDLTKWQKHSLRHPERLQKRNQDRKFKRPEGELLRAAQRRAIKFERICTITVDDIIIPETCPVLGIPIFSSNGGATDNSPSVDRIDNKQGYVPGNIQVISYRANRLKADATLNDMRRIYEWMKTLHG